MVLEIAQTAALSRALAIDLRLGLREIAVDTAHRLQRHHGAGVGQNAGHVIFL